VQKEQLGHVSGGYKTVFDRLKELIHAAGGEIRTRVSVNRIAPCPQGGLWVSYDGHQERFDKVIFTSPVNVLQGVASPELVRLANGRGTVEYLGVICLVLVTRRPLVPYYVVNIADSRIPFTGVIGTSNVVSPEETAGRYLTYLPKYVLSDDPLLRRTNEELQELFFEGVRLMFPDLKTGEIERVHINRAFRVQPLQVMNYSHLVPQVTTLHEDFFVLNTSQFVNATLNNNEVIKSVDEFLHRYGARFTAHHDSGRTITMSKVGT
jgi:protoporphyrinogen oxidase